MASLFAAFAATLAITLLRAAQLPTAAAVANLGMPLGKTAAEHASRVAGCTTTGHQMHPASATCAASAACSAMRHPSVLCSNARPAAACEWCCSLSRRFCMLGTHVEQYVVGELRYLVAYDQCPAWMLLCLQHLCPSTWANESRAVSCLRTCVWTHQAMKLHN
jgi:hypothetical protein